MEAFRRCLQPNAHLMLKIFNNDLVVRDWAGFIAQIKEVFEEQLTNKRLCHFVFVNARKISE